MLTAQNNEYLRLACNNLVSVISRTAPRPPPSPNMCSCHTCTGTRCHRAGTRSIVSISVTTCRHVSSTFNSKVGGGEFDTPHIHTAFESRYFSVAVPQAWNHLPTDIRRLSTISTFKRDTSRPICLWLHIAVRLPRPYFNYHLCTTVFKGFIPICV